MLTAIAKTYFSSDITIEIRSKSMEMVASKKTKREHVVFAISVTKSLERNAANEGPPTFVAQTKKHGERQINKSVGDILKSSQNVRRQSP